MKPIDSIVPSELCLRCDICCRFPDADSPLAPFFTEGEVKNALAAGLPPGSFNGEHAGRIRLIPFPGEVESPGHNGGCVCPSFDPLTQRCAIYEVRPLDCQLYPFALMRNVNDTDAVLGVDTKCPFVQDPRNRLVIESFSRRLNELLKSAPYQEIFRKFPELIGPFQEDVTVLFQL
jgi:Fe-S-cluster containining protein